MTGDVLAETLAAAGFALDGDMLSGEPFEALDEWGDVSDAARELGQKVREIARLNPDLVMSFESGPVYEYDADGEEISVHRKVYAKGAASLSIAGHVATIAHGSAELTPEERAEIQRLARAARAAELVRAALASELVLTVMRLLDGEPGTLELAHIHDLIQDDMNGDLSGFASEAEFTRFNRSINHPEVLGLEARHAVTNVEPPRDPMDIGEATRFITSVAQKWITEKAESGPFATDLVATSFSYI